MGPKLTEKERTKLEEKDKTNHIKLYYNKCMDEMKGPNKDHKINEEWMDDIWTKEDI